MSTSDLEAALEQFERTEVNTDRLQQLWDRYLAGVSHEIAFGLDSPESDEVRRDWSRFIEALPAIDGFKPDSMLMSYDEISMMKHEAREIDLGGIESTLWAVEVSERPGRQLADYRHRLRTGRRRLVRRALDAVMADIDELLSSTIEIDAGLQFEPVDDAGWDALGDHWQQIQGLLSTDVPGNGRWSDMGRHLHFAEPHDLRDIVVFDWPSVRQSILDHVFRDDPLPVEAADLAELSATEPTGPVTTELNWSVLDPDGFERVVLEIVVSSDGYENAKRLMSVNAPDKGRDLSADRIVSEALGGTQRLPVMIQCKHHQSRSVDLDDCVKSLEQAKLWPDAGFRVIVMATSGNFTQQAVEWVEKRAADGEFPAVELLGQSDLERLLAAKPAIRTAFGL